MQMGKICADLIIAALKHKITGRKKSNYKKMQLLV